MPSSTPRYVIPYVVIGDTVASVAQTTQDMANRLDLLNGEGGSFSAVMAANTTLLTPVTLSRTYPGNGLAGVPGAVTVNSTSQIAASTVWNWWVQSWTGTGTTITGFTIGMQASTAITRTIGWRFIPQM